MGKNDMYPTSGISFRSVKNTTSDTAMIFIHSLGASQHYWGKEYHKLQSQYSLYFIDLLGFGLSKKPSIEYSLADHIDALHEFITHEVLEKNIILVGHSVGGIIALAFSATYPGIVTKTHILSLSYFKSPKEAKRIHSRPKFLTAAFSDSWLSYATSPLRQIARPLLQHIAPLFHKHVPVQVIKDTFQNTYTSYYNTLRNVVYKQRIPQLINTTERPEISLIHGENDTVIPLKHIQALAKAYKIPCHVIPRSGHDFPLFQPLSVVPLLT